MLRTNKAELRAHPHPARRVKTARKRIRTDQDWTDRDEEEKRPGTSGDGAQRRQTPESGRPVS